MKTLVLITALMIAGLTHAGSKAKMGLAPIEPTIENGRYKQPCSKTKSIDMATSSIKKDRDKIFVKSGKLVN